LEITICTATTDNELQQILDLQQKNLYNNILESERLSEGFVTVEHSYELLRELNSECPHIIAKFEDEVVGYALCMHPKFSGNIEVLKPMFTEMETNFPSIKNFIVMGQICIDKQHRGKGIFRRLYLHMKKYIAPIFDIIITEVDAQNQRSLQAHYAVGFQDLKTHGSMGREWKLIALK